MPCWACRTVKSRRLPCCKNLICIGPYIKRPIFILWMVEEHTSAAAVRNVWWHHHHSQGTA